MKQIIAIGAISKISFDLSILPNPPDDTVLLYFTSGFLTVNNRNSEIKIVKTPINSTASRHPNMPTKYVSGDVPNKVPKDPMPRNVAASVAKIFGE